MEKIYIFPNDENRGSFDEKRAHPRKDVRVNKVFSATIIMEGETHTCRLYVADVSEGGFKITSDYPFKRNVPLEVTMDLYKPLRFKAEIPWAKDLGAGMQALGLKFLEIDDENRQILYDFIDYYTSREMSNVYRLNKVIPMRISLPDGQSEAYYVLTLEISLAGIKISHEQRLPEEGHMELMIFLEPKAHPIEVKAKVLSQKGGGEMGESHIIKLEFVDLAPEVKEYLNSYIDSAKSGLIEKKLSRPVVIFDEDSYDANL